MQQALGLLVCLCLMQSPTKYFVFHEPSPFFFIFSQNQIIHLYSGSSHSHVLSPSRTVPTVAVKRSQANQQH